MNKPSVQTIIRTIVMAVTLINSVLTMAGKNPLPFAEDELYTALSCVAAIGATLWAWWKNNSFTEAAIAADEYMHDIKSGAYEFRDYDETEEVKDDGENG